MPSTGGKGGCSEDSQIASSSSEQRQKTISELFAASKNTAARPEAADLRSLSPRKRVKHTHTSPSVATSCRGLGDMYSGFPPASPRRRNGGTGSPATATEVVDLTGSPSPTPTRPTQIKRTIGSAVRPTSTAPNGGPKKLIVKTLKTIPKTDPEKFYNEAWKRLDAALSAIFDEAALPCSNEELYRDVQSLCRQGSAAPLYKQLREKCKLNVMGKVAEPLVRYASTATSVELLDAVVKSWSTWKTQLITIGKIFCHLDRSYLLQSPTLESIEAMGYNGFCHHVFAHSSLKKVILQGAYDLLAADRQASLKHGIKDLLIGAVSMFHALGVYTKDFAPKVIGDSEEYLLLWADQKSCSLDLPGYVDECHRMIESETHRCDVFGLDRTTRDVLEAHIEDIMVERKQDVLLDTNNIGTLLDDHALQPLRRLFDLLRRRRLHEKLRPPFEAYISKTGAAIVFDEAREQEMVPRLLEFKSKLDVIWEQCFQKHPGLGHSLRESFESFINKSKRSNMTWGTDNPKPGEMIAKYVDSILKAGTKAIAPAASNAFKGETVKTEENENDSGIDEESEISNQLDQVLELFRFVHGKAVFEAFYKRDLARRLLLGRSASADAEKLMLTRLKSECGASFTHNLEHMFTDMEMAREDNAAYRSMRQERQMSSSVDLTVNVLSLAAWPSYPDIAVKIPRIIQTASADFESYYTKNKHQNRRLHWKHGLAHCQLKANFSKGNKEIVVSAFQAIVLLHFNGKDPTEAVPYTEIQSASNLDDTELKRTLQSLACAKYRVLIKTPKGREVESTDTFSINGGFTDPKYRIKINQVQAKETKQENKETHERVAADRNFETQAAIVRIMKGRKRITHVELVSEVIVATKSRGVLDPVDIKRNIERLIEKDYMERDEERRNTYNYLA